MRTNRSSGFICEVVLVCMETTNLVLLRPILDFIEMNRHDWYPSKFFVCVENILL